MFIHARAVRNFSPIPTSPLCVAVVVAACLFFGACSHAAGPPTESEPFSVITILARDRKTAFIWSRALQSRDPRAPFAKPGNMTTFAGRVAALSVSRDSSRLAVIGSRGLEVFDLSPAPSSLMTLPLDSVLTSVALSPNGRFVATGETGGKHAAKARLLEVPPWKRSVIESAPAHTALPGHAGGVHSLSFSHDGKHLITGDGAGTLRCWQVPSGRLLWRAKAHEEDAVSVICCLSTRIVSGGWDGNLRVTDLATGKIEGKIRAHRKMILALAASEDGTAVVSYGADNILALWDVKKRERLAATHIRIPQVPALSILPEGGDHGVLRRTPHSFLPSRRQFGTPDALAIEKRGHSNAGATLAARTALRRLDHKRRWHPKP